MEHATRSNLSLFVGFLEVVFDHYFEEKEDWNLTATDFDQVTYLSNKTVECWNYLLVKSICFK